MKPVFAITISAAKELGYTLLKRSSVLRAHFKSTKTSLERIAELKRQAEIADRKYKDALKVATNDAAAFFSVPGTENKRTLDLFRPYREVRSVPFMRKVVRVHAKDPKYLAAIVPSAFSTEIKFTPNDDMRTLVKIICYYGYSSEEPLEVLAAEGLSRFSEDITDIPPANMLEFMQNYFFCIDDALRVTKRYLDAVNGVTLRKIAKSFAIELTPEFVAVVKKSFSCEESFSCVVN